MDDSGRCSVLLGDSKHRGVQKGTPSGGRGHMWSCQISHLLVCHFAKSELSDHNMAVPE